MAHIFTALDECIVYFYILLNSIQNILHKITVAIHEQVRIIQKVHIV